MKTNIGEKIEVPKDTYKIMKNVQKALKMVNSVLNDTSKLQQAIAQDRDGLWCLCLIELNKLKERWI